MSVDLDHPIRPRAAAQGRGSGLAGRTSRAGPLVAGALIALLAQDAARAADMAPPPVNDPAERFNRGVFAVNAGVDHAMIRPVARTWRASVPDVVRGGIHNFGENLKGPGIAANDVLQGNFRRAGVTSARFLVNSTVGVGGFVEVGERMGMKHHSADLGQTFGRWGIPTGPTIQVPLLGSSNARDVTGGILGSLLDPLTYVTAGSAVALKAGVSVTGLINGRSEALPITDRLERTSPDLYAAQRDLLAARRARAVREAIAGEASLPGDEDRQDLVVSPDPGGA